MHAFAGRNTQHRAVLDFGVFKKLKNFVDQVPMLVRLEARLVQLQELALWIDPKSSVAALAILHLVTYFPRQFNVQ